MCGYACAVHTWCEDHEFPDKPGHFACVPAGSNYNNAVTFVEAVKGYGNCPTQESKVCAEFRKYLYNGFECPGCAANAELAAGSEAVCSAQTTKEACLATSQARYTQPNGSGGDAPAPAPVVARPSDNVGARPCCSMPFPALCRVLCAVRERRHRRGLCAVPSQCVHLWSEAVSQHALGPCPQLDMSLI